ncbi:hypothetical protein DFP72DRAFT_73598 [Ephemerocybe angulata]|uniref:Uncharacterized protein n=1 Tax=Ephemerocybe angulata TaxID=980116 RepID=A0A8H6I9Y6_9AGAR|nr:hypothetical protein DFP72DRAFT_73598 [Tulosesus angulatus]
MGRTHFGFFSWTHLNPNYLQFKMVYITKPVMVAALVIAPAIAAPVSQFADDELYTRKKEPKKSNNDPSIIHAGVLAGGWVVPGAGKVLRRYSEGFDARESLDGKLYVRKETKKSNIGPAIIHAGVVAGVLTVPAARKALPKKSTIGPALIRAGVLAGGSTVPDVGKSRRELEGRQDCGKGLMEVRELIEELEMYERDVEMSLDELD